MKKRKVISIQFVKKIIELFSEDPSIGLSILQISKKSGILYSVTHRVVEYLIQEGILTYRKKGSARIIYLKKGLAALGYLALVESSHSKNTKEFVKKVGEYAKKLS